MCGFDFDEAAQQYYDKYDERQVNSFMRARRRRRISVQPRFFVILATLLVLITTPIIVHAVRDRDQVLAIDSLTQQVQTDAVIIRKETVVAACTRDRSSL